MLNTTEVKMIHCIGMPMGHVAGGNLIFIFGCVAVSKEWNEDFLDNNIFKKTYNNN